MLASPSWEVLFKRCQSNQTSADAASTDSALLRITIPIFDDMLTLAADSFSDRLPFRWNPIIPQQCVCDVRPVSRKLGKSSQATGPVHFDLSPNKLGPVGAIPIHPVDNLGRIELVVHDDVLDRLVEDIEQAGRDLLLDRISRELDPHLGPVGIMLLEPPQLTTSRRSALGLNGHVQSDFIREPVSDEATALLESVN